MSRKPDRASRAAHRRHLPLAPFGRETRYVARLYLLRIFVVAAATMTIVLALDTAINMAFVMSERGAASGQEGFARLAYYLGLRAAYNIPAILPIAAVVGVVWAEFTLSSSYERLMIFNGARAPLRSLMPAVLIGIVLGIGQFAALSYARPLAVEAQALAGFRDYGPRFRADAVTPHKWIAIEDALVHARIAFTDPVGLRDVMVYGLDKAGQLEIVVSAEKAEPADKPGLWKIINGSFWSRPADAARRQRDKPAEKGFESAAIRLPLDPLWVTNFEVPARFLAQDELRALASAGSGIPEAFSYRTGYQSRLAALLIPLAMTILGATACLLLLRPRVGLAALLKIGLVGYGVHVASKILTTLGEYGYLPPAIAAWALPLAVIAGCVLLLAERERRIAVSLTRQTG